MFDLVPVKKVGYNRSLSISLRCNQVTVHAVQHPVLENETVLRFNSRRKKQRPVLQTPSATKVIQDRACQTMPETGYSNIST